VKSSYREILFIRKMAEDRMDNDLIDALWDLGDGMAEFEHVERMRRTYYELYGTSTSARAKEQFKVVLQHSQETLTTLTERLAFRVRMRRRDTCLDDIDDAALERHMQLRKEYKERFGTPYVHPDDEEEDTSTITTTPDMFHTVVRVPRAYDTSVCSELTGSSCFTSVGSELTRSS
jgi:2-oxo-4-hydroxy-4-carboxy--5-ureidoimidazoline (OHCU) decarboxylase